ncbi:putative CCAAT-binding transcription factor [Tieghemostelium lacteum]|uniref:Nuclear transcription factor Y subunit n=1 Tax=Tieghemostelium lacteum TaxID=361077 RepID=A0A152A8Q6_TIELA|nr:putative CCAAT-binding transcription factor [Tieghemostelium lacteum]|eukprot:KYR02437.1 putative CCAAT-binding transcription factor [Tieghemostelium lacteum]
MSTQFSPMYMEHHSYHHHPHHHNHHQHHHQHQHHSGSSPELTSQDLHIHQISYPQFHHHQAPLSHDERLSFASYANTSGAYSSPSTPLPSGSANTSSPTSSTHIPSHATQLSSSPIKMNHSITSPPGSLLMIPSVGGGLTPSTPTSTSSPLTPNTFSNASSSSGDDEPIYVNSKQYARIIKRRTARANELITLSRQAKKPYQHESRHQHAIKRARGSGGRFLTKEKNAELQASLNNTSSNETSPKDSSTPTSPLSSTNTSYSPSSSTTKIPKTKTNNNSSKKSQTIPFIPSSQPNL